MTATCSQDLLLPYPALCIRLQETSFQNAREVAWQVGREVVGKRYLPAWYMLTDADHAPQSWLIGCGMGIHCIHSLPPSPSGHDSAQAPIVLLDDG
ncbi:hypothetical protein IAQ61_005808 [Plenodomus lingam]|uniref:uncharacterized protein n=1 Tax=Leptosphaeria maculans TaxID=5022 RepID=UPI00332ECBED|nr:hypothetical protein IAQ61_005808 [Plenodomus lingam]